MLSYHDDAKTFAHPDQLPFALIPDLQRNFPTIISFHFASTDVRSIAWPPMRGVCGCQFHCKLINILMKIIIQSLSIRRHCLGTLSKHRLFWFPLWFSINMRLYSKLHELEICTFILEICFRGIEKSKLDSRLVTFCMMKVTVLGESQG